MTLTPEEIETVKALIDDWGFEYSLKADRQKVRDLARKIGMDHKTVELLLGEDEPTLEQA